jgi:hypothetical protein
VIPVAAYLKPSGGLLYLLQYAFGTVKPLCMSGNYCSKGLLSTTLFIIRVVACVSFIRHQVRIVIPVAAFLKPSGGLLYLLQYTFSTIKPLCMSGDCCPKGLHSTTLFIVKVVACVSFIRHQTS